MTKSDRVATGDYIPTPSGYQKSDCDLIVTVEDHHYGGNRSTSIGDLGYWEDNHYGGSQAFYDSNWRVTCRYAFSLKNIRDASWHDEHEKRCRYLLVCH